MEDLLIIRNATKAQPAEIIADPNLDLPDFYLDQKNPEKNKYYEKEKSEDYSFLSKNLNKEFLKNQYKIAKSNFARKKSTRNAYALGEIFLLKKIFSTAKNYYKISIELDKSFLPAYEKLVLVSIILNETDRANYYYKLLLEVSNHRPDLVHSYALFRVASSAGDKTTLDETLKDLDQILALQPLDIAAINSYGFILLNFYQKLDEAQQYFEKALEIDSTFVHSMNNLAVCYIHKNDLTKAISLLEKAIKIHPNYVMAYQNLAGIYFRTNKLAEVSKILKQAVKNNITLSDETKHLSGWLLILTHKYEEAKNWYLKEIMGEPGNNLLYNNLGYAYQQLKDLNKAEEYYKQAVDIAKRRKAKNLFVDDRSLFAFYNLGRLFQFFGKVDELHKISNDILNWKPEDPFGQYLYGSALVIDGKHDAAKKQLLKVVEKYPKLPETYQDLSYIYDSIDKDYKASIDLLNDAIKIGINLPIIYNNLAIAYINLGDFKNAEDTLNKITDDCEPTIIATRGLLAFRKNDSEKGNKYYKKAVDEIKPQLKNLANQIWLYEQAFYFFRTGKLEEAKIKLKESKKMGKSYMTKDITELENKLT